METSESWTRAENLPANRYLFNGGSEWNSKAGIYETYYRGYDPALGRMTAIDPMALKYSGISPYNFAFNNPVSLNDPSGADPYGDRLEGADDYLMYDSYAQNWVSWAGELSDVFTSITPGSGNHYSDEFRGAYGDYFLMSGSDFNVKYGLPNGTDVRIKNGQVGYYVKSTGWSGFEVYDKYGNITQMMHLTLVNTFVEGALLGQGNWPPSEDLEVRFQESVESNFLLPLRNRFSMKVFSDKSLVDLISYVNRYANFPYKDDVSKIGPQYQDGLPDSWSNPVNITLRGFYISIDTELVYKKPFVDGFNGEYDYNGDFGAPRFNTSFISTEGKIINLFFHYQVFETF